MWGKKAAYQQEEFNDRTNEILVHGDRPWEFVHIDHTWILLVLVSVFKTELAQARTFYNLIRNAEAITVALEPTYVLGERISSETITSEFLLSCLQQYLRSALSGRVKGRVSEDEL
jgi:hypothetical protein